MTFVLVILFWEYSRGYAITTIEGYKDKALCETAVQDVKKPPNGGYAISIYAFCVTGPSK